MTGAGDPAASALIMRIHQTHMMQMWGERCFAQSAGRWGARGTASVVAKRSNNRHNKPHLHSMLTKGR